MLALELFTFLSSSRLLNTVFEQDIERGFFAFFACHVKLRNPSQAEMDITRQSFFYLLPRILSELADCEFVALDLELSGISLRPAQGRLTKASAGRQTLQQRYEEVKEAAERYQILQLGLTLVKEDARTG